jgi:hypothetical protein
MHGCERDGDNVRARVAVGRFAARLIHIQTSIRLAIVFIPREAIFGLVAGTLGRWSGAEGAVGGGVCDRKLISYRVYYNLFMPLRDC